MRSHHLFVATCLGFAAVLPAQAHQGEAMGKPLVAYQKLNTWASQWASTRADVVSDVEYLGAKKEAYEVCVDGPFGLNRASVYRLEIGERVVASGRINTDGSYVVGPIYANVFPNNVVDTLGLRSGPITLDGNMTGAVAMDLTYTFTKPTWFTAYADITGRVLAKAEGKMSLLRSPSYSTIRAIMTFGGQELDGHFAHASSGSTGLRYYRSDVYLLLEAGRIIFPTVVYDRVLLDQRSPLTIDPFLP